MYYYVIDEYRVSNQLLTEDIYVRIPTYILYAQARSQEQYIGAIHLKQAMANESRLSNPPSNG